MATDSIRSLANPIPADTRVPPASGGVVIASEGSGYVRLIMAAGGYLDVYVTQGTAEFPNYAVIGWSSAGTTTATPPRVTNVS